MKCIIPAAGKGTRFGAEIPKALVEVNGQTILSRQIEKLSRTCDIRVVIGYKADLVIEEISKHNFKVDIFFNKDYETTTVVDSVRLGTCGLDKNVLVIDGDVLFDDISVFLDGSPRVGVKPPTSEQPMYATVKDGKVIGFSETNGNYEWAGISVMPPEIYQQDNRYVCDAISKILPIQSHEVKAFEIDTPRDLKGAERWITTL